MEIRRVWACVRDSGLVGEVVVGEEVEVVVVVVDS
jgi:hypothetical protein